MSLLNSSTLDPKNRTLNNPMIVLTSQQVDQLCNELFGEVEDVNTIKDVCDYLVDTIGWSEVKDIGKQLTLSIICSDNWAVNAIEQSFKITTAMDDLIGKGLSFNYGWDEELEEFFTTFNHESQDSDENNSITPVSSFIIKILNIPNSKDKIAYIRTSSCVMEIEPHSVVLFRHQNFCDELMQFIHDTVGEAFLKYSKRYFKPTAYFKVKLKGMKDVPCYSQNMRLYDFNHNVQLNKNAYSDICDKLMKDGKYKMNEDYSIHLISKEEYENSTIKGS